MNTPMKAGSAYILLIHLFLAFVLWKSNFIDKIEARMGITGPILSFYDQMTIYHQTMDGSIPEDSVIFIGDSITQALATSAITDDGINLGIGTDTTGGVVKRIPFYNSIKRAKTVVLAIGINDIHQNVDRLETLSNYKFILEHIPSNITVVASSVIPIGSGAESKYFTNADILSLNNEIAELTSEYGNVVFLNTGIDLKNDAGYLHRAFHIGDGVHLSDAGYSILIEKLKDTLVAMQD